MLTAGANTDTFTSRDHSERCARLIDRTRGLIGLLVKACGGSRIDASKRVAVDGRTLDQVRAVPTLRFVSRIGGALGLEAKLMTEVMAAEPRARRTPEEIRHAILQADLHDDAVLLEQSAAELQRTPAHPSDLGLAQLVRARAAVARGDARSALALVDVALGIGLGRDDRAIAGELARTIDFELRLSTPWAMTTGHERPMHEGLSWLVEVCGTARVTHGDEGGWLHRARAWSVGLGIIRGELGPRALLREARALLDDAQHPEHIAWSASIIALAALWRRRSAIAPGEAERLVEAIVAAEFALDDALADAGPAHEPLFLARRTRVALAEWLVRAELGEIDQSMIDELDSEELARARMWFPSAGEALRAHGSLFVEITKSQTHTLDASSRDCWMVEQVHSCTPRGRTQARRSEDPC